ncbi:MAG: hypothetical protein WCF25_11925 [Acidimicrobiales bacterium]
MVLTEVGDRYPNGESVSSRVKHAFKCAAVVILLVGAGLLVVNSHSPTRKNARLAKVVTVPTTLAPVGIWQGRPVMATQGTFSGTEILGTLPANSGFTITMACSPPGTLRVSVAGVVSSGGRCNGKAASLISWSVVTTPRLVRVSATSALWRVAIFPSKQPQPLAEIDWTNT